MNRLKSDRSANSSIYVLLIVHSSWYTVSCFSLQWPCLCTESMHETTETEYAISETTKPQSYCGEVSTFFVIPLKQAACRAVPRFRTIVRLVNIRSFVKEDFKNACITIGGRNLQGITLSKPIYNIEISNPDIRWLVEADLEDTKDRKLLQNYLPSALSITVCSPCSQKLGCGTLQTISSSVYGMDTVFQSKSTLNDSLSPWLAASRNASPLRTERNVFKIAFTHPVWKFFTARFNAKLLDIWIVRQKRNDFCKPFASCDHQWGAWLHVSGN